MRLPWFDKFTPSPCRWPSVRPVTPHANGTEVKDTGRSYRSIKEVKEVVVTILCD